MKNLTIRTAQAKDTATIANFNQLMAQETEGKELIPEVIEAGVAAVFEKPERGFYLIAEGDSTIHGSLMVTREWSDWRNGEFWWIQSVYVIAESRGQGVYRRLYESLKERALKAENVCGFRLYVELENEAAQKTYSALGMGELDYKIYEELKEGVEFLR